MLPFGSLEDEAFWTKGTGVNVGHTTTAIAHQLDGSSVDAAGHRNTAEGLQKTDSSTHLDLGHQTGGGWLSQVAESSQIR